MSNSLCVCVRARARACVYVCVRACVCESFGLRVSISPILPSPVQAINGLRGHTAAVVSIVLLVEKKTRRHKRNCYKSVAWGSGLVNKVVFCVTVIKRTQVELKSNKSL